MKPKERGEERAPVFMTVMYSEDVLMIFLHWKINSSLRNRAIFGDLLYSTFISIYAT
jgi:hypothetical protein